MKRNWKIFQILSMVFNLLIEMAKIAKYRKNKTCRIRFYYSFWIYDIQQLQFWKKFQEKNVEKPHFYITDYHTLILLNYFLLHFGTSKMSLLKEINYNIVFIFKLCIFFRFAAEFFRVASDDWSFFNFEGVHIWIWLRIHHCCSRWSIVSFQ